MPGEDRCPRSRPCAERRNEKPMRGFNDEQELLRTV
jgi:hypothetical protein